MKTKTKIITFSVITTIITIGFFSLMVFMSIENGKCINNPFEYSAKKLSESSNGSYLCGCSSYNPQLLGFSFNETGIYIDKHYSYAFTPSDQFNFITDERGY